MKKNDKVTVIYVDSAIREAQVLLGQEGTIVNDLPGITSLFDVRIKDKTYRLNIAQLQKVNTFEKGDYVQLLHMGKHERESDNYTEKDGLSLRHHYKIVHLSGNDTVDHRWLKFEGKILLHHPDKFKIIRKQADIPKFQQFDLVKPIAGPMAGKILIISQIVKDNVDNQLKLLCKISGQQSVHQYTLSEVVLYRKYYKFKRGDLVSLVDYNNPLHRADPAAVAIHKDKLDAFNIYKVAHVDDRGYIQLLSDNKRLIHYHPHYCFIKVEEQPAPVVPVDTRPVNEQLAEIGWNWISLVKV